MGRKAKAGATAPASATSITIEAEVVEQELRRDEKGGVQYLALNNRQDIDLDGRRADGFTYFSFTAPPGAFSLGDKVTVTVQKEPSGKQQQWEFLCECGYLWHDTNPAPPVCPSCRGEYPHGPSGWTLS